MGLCGREGGREGGRVSNRLCLRMQDASPYHGQTRKRRREGAREGAREGREGLTSHLLEPLGLGLDGHEVVVGVHDRVHGVVHGNEVHAGVRRLVGRPGEVEDGHVVVPVIKVGKGER